MITGRTWITGENRNGSETMVSKLIRDEAGMTMGIVIIMIVLIGVMGAGLLTFVSTDLNAVVEANQGQRAFEMGDAGIEAAKKQIRDEDPNPNHYGGADGATGDIQWAASEGGKDLTMSGTADEVNVQIQSNVPSAGYYTVTSLGSSGEAQRRVEAVLYHTANFGGGGIPAWYTRGGIRIKKDALANGVSLFAGGDIELKSASVGSGSDILGDWFNPPYNTTTRKDPSTGDAYTKAGIAAEGQVSGDTTGILFYDSDTSTKFVGTPTSQPQPANEISYPFSREVNLDGLLARAQSGGENTYLTSASANIPESTEKRVVFVDAGGGTVDFNKDATFKGILVVRCGDVNMDKSGTFEGMIIAIQGAGPGCASTGKVNFKKSLTINGYVYAESSDSRAIDTDKDPVIGPIPEGYDDLSKLAFISSVETVSWREMYE